MHFNGLPDRTVVPTKIPENVQSPPTAHRSHIPGFNAILAPHTFSRLPMRFCGLPHTGHFPIGFAVPPYGHTPDISLHTFWQIPIGRPFSHTPHQIPTTKPSPHTVSADPPYDPQALKNSTSNSERPAFRFHKSPTNPVKQTPWTCVTIQQTNPQPVQANNTRHSLRKSHAGQVTQILQTCEGGGGVGTSCMGMRTPASTRTFTGMGTSARTRAHSRVCAYLHGHAHTFTVMRTAMAVSQRQGFMPIPGHVFAETSGRRRRSPTNPVKQTP